MERLSPILAIPIMVIALLAPAQADVSESTGKITLLRVNDVGTGYGPPDDFIDAEVIVRLDSQPGKAFGFQLRRDANYQSHRSEFALLRRAFQIGRPVTIDYDLAPGKNNGTIIRTWLTPTSWQVEHTAAQVPQPQNPGPLSQRLPRNNLEDEEWSGFELARNFGGSYDISPGGEKVITVDLEGPSILFVRVTLFGDELEKLSAQLYQVGLSQPQWAATATKLRQSQGYIKGQISIGSDKLAAGKRWDIKLSNTSESKSAKAEVTVGTLDLRSR